MIEQILEEVQKKKIARYVLESLREWFGIDEARERYITESGGQIFFAAKVNREIVGFLCLKETSKDTAEIAVMGVPAKYQRQGVGRELFEAAKRKAKLDGYSFLQVKTVQLGLYESYDKTNLFYLNCGFKELETFPTLWDEHNPCTVYVMSLV